MHACIHACTHTLTYIHIYLYADIDRTFKVGKEDLVDRMDRGYKVEIFFGMTTRIHYNNKQRVYSWDTNGA